MGIELDQAISLLELATMMLKEVQQGKPAKPPKPPAPAPPPPAPVASSVYVVSGSYVVAGYVN